MVRWVFPLLIIVVVSMTPGVLSQCDVTRNQQEGSSKVAFRASKRVDIWGVNNNYTDITQTIFNCSTGQFGYNWNRVSSATHLPCYPEAIFGASPFTSGKSTTSNLPLRLSSIGSIIATHDINISVSDGQGKNYWDFAYDIWFNTKEPGTGVAVDEYNTDEIMIWFGWNSDSKPTPVQANAVDDGYNTYDYSIYTIMDGKWRYHQFRITGGQRIPKNVNFQPFFEYVQHKYNIPEDEWLCDLELGTETGDGTSGSALFTSLKYQFHNN